MTEKLVNFDDLELADPANYDKTPDARRVPELESFLAVQRDLLQKNQAELDFLSRPRTTGENTPKEFNVSPELEEKFETGRRDNVEKMKEAIQENEANIADVEKQIKFHSGN